MLLLDASSHLYEGLVRPSVRRSDCNAFVKFDEKWTFKDSRGRTRKKELYEGERVTKRKEGRGGRSDEEGGATRRMKK